MVWLNDAYFNSEFINGQPLYLFPTQRISKLDNKRANQYIKMFRSNAQRSQSISYHFNQSINFLLDDHHKSCASALMHEPVNTLVKTPLTYHYTNYNNGNLENTQYQFADFTIPKLDIPQKYRI